MVNGKCRQGERVIATNLTRSSDSTFTSSTKCLTNMSKSTTITSRGQTALLPHRKVFMITEKSGEKDEQRGTTDATTAGRKRKMILIMDDKPQDNTVSTIQRQNGMKHVKTENDSTTMTTTSNNVAGAPKLLFFANSVDDQISQKIEEILPEILSRIQWKNGRAMDGNESSHLSKQQQAIHIDNSNSNSNDNGNTRDNRSTEMYKTHQQRTQALLHEDYSDNSNSEIATTTTTTTTTVKNADYISHHSNNSNLMLLGAAAAATVASHTTESMRRITLPPKKNLSKFQKQLSDNAGDQIISAATPVIVSTKTLVKINNQVSAIKTSTDNNRNLNINKNNSNTNSNSSYQQKINKIHQINYNNQIQQQNQNQNQQYHQNIHPYNNNQDNKNRYHNQNHSSNKNNNNNNNNNYNSNNDDKTTNSEKSSIVVQQQNINLTGDFLFLMKMLPMLEKTPEPRKSQVKLLIEKIMKQCVAGDNPQ